MKVLLVYVNSLGTASHGRAAVKLPLGLAYISSVLKRNGHKVDLVISRIEAFDLNGTKLQKRNTARDTSRRNWTKPVLLVRAEKRISVTQEDDY